MVDALMAYGKAGNAAYFTMLTARPQTVGYGATDSPAGLAAARAEEAIIRAHVDNALMFVDTLAEDLSFDRAIDTYVRAMAIPEPLASVVAVWPKRAADIEPVRLNVPVSGS